MQLVCLIISRQCMLVGGNQMGRRAGCIITIIKPLHHKKMDRKAKSDRKEAKQLITDTAETDILVMYDRE